MGTTVHQDIASPLFPTRTHSDWFGSGPVLSLAPPDCASRFVYAGTLKRGDRIVMCGFGGPVVTRVRELLTPKPLREIRVKADYLHHQSIDGSAGIKICANHLDGVVVSAHPSSAA